MEIISYKNDRAMVELPINEINAVKSVNKLCKGCLENCKQSGETIIIKCHNYRDQDQEGERGRNGTRRGTRGGR